MKPAILMDIESVPCKRRIKAATGKDFEAYRDGLRSETGEGNPFIPAIFQRPVALAFLSVKEEGDSMSIKAGVLTEKIALRWWKGWEARSKENGYPLPIVGWNSRGFDLPMLETEALSQGIPVPRWFRPPGTRSYEDPRNRFGGTHLDLMDWATNTGGSPRVSMNNFATAIGIPGKLGTDGGDVAAMVEAGRMDDVSAYCATDVLTLFGIFIRWHIVHGAILDEERLIGEACNSFRGFSSAFEPKVSEWIETLGTLQEKKRCSNAEQQVRKKPS